MKPKSILAWHFVGAKLRNGDPVPPDGEWLEWKGHDYVEYDVESDSDALARMRALTGGQRTVPVLAKDGRVSRSVGKAAAAWSTRAPSRRSISFTPALTPVAPTELKL